MVAWRVKTWTSGCRLMPAKHGADASTPEVHQGHMHTQKVVEGKYVTSTQTEDVGGVVVRTMPVICNASYWEHGQGLCRSDQRP